MLTIGFERLVGRRDCGPRVRQIQEQCVEMISISKSVGADVSMSNSYHFT